MADILIVDDNRGMRDMLVRTLVARGYAVDQAEDGQQGLELARARPYDLVIADMRMPRLGGLELLDRLRAEAPTALVMVMTAYSSVETAVEAMRRGAFDYLEKPFSLDAVETRVERALKVARVQESNRYLRDVVEAGQGAIIGASPAISAVLKLVGKVAPTPSPVLILGESGTGKELIAREIHRQSRRADAPFVTVNCAALAEGVLESELFGHVAGSFTGATGDRKGKFEIADGGTLFLDEIGEVSLETQVKLLRFLQEKTIERVGDSRTLSLDVRVIAATNRDLKLAIRDGIFREDLYYRIRVVDITLPPLRERKEDIPILAEHFLAAYNRELHRQVTLSTEAACSLQVYDWPGNIRELENIIERAVVLCEDGTILLSDLPNEVVQPAGMAFAIEEGLAAAGMGLTGQVELYERTLIQRALEAHDGNQSKAAESLGLKRSSLQYKLKKYEII